MGYGPDVLETIAPAATYVDKILKGAKPRTCLSSSRQVRVGHHLKTAQALGLTIPQSLLVRGRGDQVMDGGRSWVRSLPACSDDGGVPFPSARHLIHGGGDPSAGILSE
jgi:hypothetical protein